METELIGNILFGVAGILAVSIGAPLLFQYVTGVSRNISLTNQNMTEEISRTAKQAS